MHFALVSCALLALPPPPYDPAAQHTYEGLVPGSRTTRGLATVTRTAPLAAAITANTNATDPVHALGPASSFRQAMGVPHALSRAPFQKVCVCMRVFASLILRTLRLKLTIQYSSFRSALQKL